MLKVLQWAAPYLAARGIDSPRATAEILLAHALHTERVQLYVHHDQPLEPVELAAFKQLLRRRLRREPVAYIVGWKGFWTLELTVTPEVLIPRPETEGLVEAALAALNALPHGRTARVLDLGTGSGAIVLALAAEAPGHRYFASDISPAAIAVARRNAEAAGVSDRVFFWAADWFSALQPVRGVFAEIARYEPRQALDGDADGLRSHRAIVAAAHRHLAPGGRLLLEIGCDQGRAVQQIIEPSGRYVGFQCTKDYSGRERVVSVRKKDVATP
ncbi:MAG: peptide chain release factor N(5)-glutamine methyltransferase [Desulfobacterales bacterium]|nr:peptide chain release factor N(5)-glutamine methyltransferase [Desulfobacterales bacterium]